MGSKTEIWGKKFRGRVGEKDKKFGRGESKDTENDDAEIGWGE